MSPPPSKRARISPQYRGSPVLRSDMSANGSAVPTSQNGAGTTQEDGEFSLRGRIKQKLLSASPSGLAERQKKRNFTEREQESIKVIGQHLRDLGLS